MFLIYGFTFLILCIWFYSWRTKTNFLDHVQNLIYGIFIFLKILYIIVLLLCYYFSRNRFFQWIQLKYDEYQYMQKYGYENKKPFVQRPLLEDIDG